VAIIRDMEMKLLTDADLERSGVVANCRMNRERTLTDSNGYSKELGFNPLDVLMESSEEPASWLDLCCGSGKALIEAAQRVHDQRMEASIQIVGVDLVAPLSLPDPRLTCLRFVEASLARWDPTGRFDLITCVHGLHYVGNKFDLIARALSWLKDKGLFAANLDLNNIRLTSGGSARRIVARELRNRGVEYDGRRRLLRCFGRKSLQLPFRYLGADDQAGPNYMKQPAVDSHYERLDSFK
jgi:SAM-dependent methyltransferase